MRRARSQKCLPLMFPPPRGNVQMATDIAEDFKQGAKIDKASCSRGGCVALCLKFRCAKPLQNASSYVFWKLTVLERGPKEQTGVLIRKHGRHSAATLT